MNSGRRLFSHSVEEERRGGSVTRRLHLRWRRMRQRERECLAYFKFTLLSVNKGLSKITYAKVAKRRILKTVPCSIVQPTIFNFTGNVDRMSHWKWTETNQQPSRAGSGFESAVAEFPSISCATSYLCTLYSCFEALFCPRLSAPNG